MAEDAFGKPQTKTVRAHFRRFDQAAPSAHDTKSYFCCDLGDGRSREGERNFSDWGKHLRSRCLKLIARWAKSAVLQNSLSQFTTRFVVQMAIGMPGIVAGKYLGILGDPVFYI